MNNTIKKKQYQQIMLKIKKEDLPPDWVKKAVFNLFGKLESIEQYHRYYNTITNVRLGRSYKKGVSLGIIQYIINEVKEYTGRDLFKKQ